MSERDIALLLPRLRAVGDPRLYQYVAAIYARGYSYRTLADVLHVSHQTVVNYVERANEEQATGNVLDLSGLPDPNRLSRRPRPGKLSYLSPTTIDVLRTLNEAAQNYRHTGDTGSLETFHVMVQGLVEQGVPFPAIARAVGQDPRHLRRRLAGHGVYPTKSRARLHPRMIGPDSESGAAMATALAEPEPEPAPPVRTVCVMRYPDCPATTGFGECIH